jgi:hypothetical protein
VNLILFIVGHFHTSTVDTTALTSSPSHVFALAFAEAITLANIRHAFLGRKFKNTKASFTDFHLTNFATSSIFMGDTMAYDNEALYSRIKSIIN